MSGKLEPAGGEVSAPYWDAVLRDELHVQRCRACGHHFLYPRRLCPQCWSTDLGWVRACGSGVVMALSTVHQAPFAAFADDVPYTIAIVKLAEGPQLMTNLVDVGEADLRVGTAVRVVFQNRGSQRLPMFTTEGEPVVVAS